MCQSVFDLADYKISYKDMEDKVSVDRLEICKGCPSFNVMGLCNHCGCFMRAKVKIMSATCPTGNWGKFSHVNRK